MVLENIYSFARNQAETINKFLYLDKQTNRTNKPNYRDIHLLLYELQAG
jgi:hypothetical protein